jgi:hypothetical protein
MAVSLRWQVKIFEPGYLCSVSLSVPSPMLLYQSSCWRKIVQETREFPSHLLLVQILSLPHQYNLICQQMFDITLGR